MRWGSIGDERSRPVSDAMTFQRKPLIISGNSLWSGEFSTRIESHDPNAVLRTYLTFVREMRGQKRAPSVSLRGQDVAVLATYLGTTEETVFGGLLDLMGATQEQRSTAAALLAAGALTVVLSGAAVAGLSTDGISVPFERLADVVRSAISGSDSGTTTAETAASQSSAATVEGSTVGQTATVAPLISTMPPTDAALEGVTGAPAAALSTTLLAELTLITPTSDVLQSVADASVANTTGTDTEAAVSTQEPVSIGIAPDGSIVASVAPPVPAPAAPATEPVAIGTAGDGSTVGVAAPPVPAPAPPETDTVAVGEAPDGSTVAVVAPPVPAPTP